MIKEDFMAVIQEAFFIPDDIATGLATGLYRRLGGVVRYAVGPNKGQIVKHLNPISLPVAEEATGVVARTVKLLKENRKYFIVSGVIIVIGGGGIVIYNYVKKHEPAEVIRFKEALAQYIEAIRTGTMESEKINVLTDALNRMRMHKNSEQLTIKLTAEEIGILVNRIYEYTIVLARNNDYELEMERPEEGSDPLYNLLGYLTIQKRIFDEAA